MNQEPSTKITLSLPSGVYHRLRNEAHRQNISLPEMIRKKIEIKPIEPSTLAELSLKEIIQRTTPQSSSPDTRIDFFS